MPNDSVVISVEGKVSVADFRTVVESFSDLLMALTAETNSDAAVEWFITDLAAGSATITSQGIFGNQESAHTVELVVDKYRELAMAAADGNLRGFSDRVRENIYRITSVVNGKIPRIKMGSAGDSSLTQIENRLEGLEESQDVTRRFAFEPRSYSRTAIKGQIVTLDDKHGTYFTLQEAYVGRLVRCYPESQFRDHLGEFWEKRRWIIVEGTYQRNANSPALTNITEITPIPDKEKGAWRKSVGIAPRGPDAQNIDSAEAVRRMRDAEA